MPCSQIKAEWAAQRIKGLDAFEIMRKMLVGNNGRRVKTLVEEFDYPLLGAGQMYEALGNTITSRGATVMLATKVEGFNRKEEYIESVDMAGPDGSKLRVYADQFFSSIPLTHLFSMLKSPGTDLSTTGYADMLRYRDHITVHILIDGEDVFPDQWIYIHSPDVRMARLANYNNFSNRMAGNSKKTAVSAEYFVYKDEPLWKMPDSLLGELAIKELNSMGVIEKGRARWVAIVRESEVYPSYYMGFEEPYRILKAKVDTLRNLYSIGRAGMYKYNNQDHSLLSGILAARNYLRLPGTPYVLWDINVDEEFHESAERHPGLKRTKR